MKRLLQAALIAVLGIHTFPGVSQDIPTNRNPKYNSSINPKYNSSINPKYNSSINPKLSQVSGLYLFNGDGESVGMFVRADSSVLNWYSSGLELRGMAASNEDGGFNLFDDDGEWQGYLLKNDSGGYNMFDIEGEWKGFTT